MHRLCVGLVKKGHRVSVLTGFPNYPSGQIYSGYKQSLWKKEFLDGVYVTRIPLYPDRSQSFIKRSLNNLIYPIIASILGPFLCERADIMMVESPPITLGIPAFIISRIRKFPFVFQIQDIWPETLKTTGMVTSKKILSILDKIGLFTYNKSAAIAVISEGFKLNLINKKIPDKKIHVIHNWAYEAEFPVMEPDPVAMKKFGLDNGFKVLYAGNMGPAQGLHNVISAALLLHDIKDLEFIFVGGGIELERLKKLTKSKNLHNLKFIPRIPMEEMPKLYPLVNAVLVHLTDDPLFEITIPGKTQSCLLSGRPIIASVNGDVTKLIKKSGAGITVKAMHPEELANAIRDLYYMPIKKREAMGNAGRDYYFNNLSPEIQIAKYEKLLEQVISDSNKKKYSQKS